MSELLTVSQFIKRYFARGSRPSKATVVEWIKNGTRENIKLRANKLDGVYYVALDDAETFMLKTSVVSKNDRLRELGFVV